MKINMAHPPTGQQKKIEIEDESKLRAFYDKRIGAEIPGESLGEEFKGYILKIAGGQDKQGFPMKQGVLTNTRVKILMSPGDSGFRGHNRRTGEKRRKSVRGCIVGHDIAVLNIIIVKKGEQDLPGLTDEEKPRLRGPKRASKIRKLFNLAKNDDVRKYVLTYSRKREVNGKVRKQSVKVQRLVTPLTLQRKRRIASLKQKQIEKKNHEAAEYKKMMMARLREQREKRSESLAKKRAIRQASQASKEAQKA